MPNCGSPLTIGDHVIAEICHIRARRKNGPRFDPLLSSEEKDDFKNLLLLCPTCHTLADKKSKTYSVELLTEIKDIHERNAPVEISAAMAHDALMILSKHNERANRKRVGSFSSKTVASGNGIAVSVSGDNIGGIHIASKGRIRDRHPANSIGGDANMTNYIDYLCDLYVKYMSPVEPDQRVSHGKLGRHIKNRFRLRKRTRNQLSTDRFFELVDYLIEEKLAKTPVGRRHRRAGNRICRTFDEFRHGVM